MRKHLWWFLVSVGCVAPANDLSQLSSEETQPGPDRATLAPLKAAVHPPVTSGTWTPVAAAATFAGSNPLLLPDGTVMLQDAGTAHWWKLAPDNTGSYINGTFTQLASTGSYAPTYYAEAVLPDGRVIVEGGEYLSGNEVDTTQGQIYSPATNTWASMTPPSGWQTIGDASGVLLPSGTFMLSSCCDANGAQATLDASTLAWTSTGTGKADFNDEEGWTLLPDGKLLTVDANNTAKPLNWETYDPSTGAWTSNGNVPVSLVDAASHEIGPAILRPDGTVLATGGTGHNAVFDSSTMTWAAAPDFPTGNDIADGPGAVLPNGNVLVAVSPGVFQTNTSFYEWDGTAFTAVAAPSNAAADSSYQVNFAVLPTGQILETDQVSDIEIYTPAGSPDPSWAPVITAIPVEVTASHPNPPTIHPGAVPLVTLHRGRTYQVWADRLNGLTQGAFYGDDTQAASNFPLVRITNAATNHVAFARSHHNSTYAIGPSVSGTTKFDIPATLETGTSTLSLVTNGIASPAITVEID